MSNIDLSKPHDLPALATIALDAMATAIKAKDWSSAIGLFTAISEAVRPPHSQKQIVAWMHPTTNLTCAEQWVYGPLSRPLVFADANHNTKPTLKETTSIGDSTVYLLTDKQRSILLDYATMGSAATTKLTIDSLNSLRPLDVFSEADMANATSQEMRFGLSIARAEIERLKTQINQQATQPIAAAPAEQQLVRDLAGLVGRMATSLSQVRPASTLANTAMDFLKRHKLGSKKTQSFIGAN